MQHQSLAQYHEGVVIRLEKRVDELSLLIGADTRPADQRSEEEERTLSALQGMQQKMAEDIEDIRKEMEEINKKISDIQLLILT